MRRSLKRQKAGKFEIDVDGTVTNVTKTNTNRWWQFGERSDGEGGGLGGIAMAAGALPLVASLFMGGGQASYDDEQMPGPGGVSPMVLGGGSCVVCCCFLVVVLVVGVVVATK